MEQEQLFDLITTLVPDAKPSDKPSDTPAIEVAAEKLLLLMQPLKEDERLAFDMLMFHTAIDWVQEEIFELVYHLFSTRHLQKLRVLVTVPRNNPVVPTVSAIWQIAEWHEREVYDLFGVLYDNHPDLRRLLLEDDWQGFPLRKDYQDDFMIAPPKSPATGTAK
jgi:NADH/F420H2 dehydrogenase subunit C